MSQNDLDFICMIDMHAHLLCLSEEYRGKLTEQEMLALGMQELAARKECGIGTVFSCGTPQEWEFMQRCLAQSFLFSFGIHPWYSDRFDPRDCRESFAACPIIGEIGMDSVWCEVPLTVQRRIFARQLEIAAELGKPVVLHTKGQERQIAEMIRDFPGKVCVHWYSGDEENLEKFMEAGCYFTLGPDLAERCAPAGEKGLWNGRTGLTQAEQEALSQSAAVYRRMLREVPTERLFLETDGLTSIAWMRGQSIESVSFKDISTVLERNMDCTARAKQMQPEQLQVCLKENFSGFIS